MPYRLPFPAVLAVTAKPLQAALGEMEGFEMLHRLYLEKLDESNSVVSDANSRSS